MDQLLLGELIAETRRAIRPLQHSQSTLWQYDYAWREFRAYFTKHGQSYFSSELAQQFIVEARQRYEDSSLKFWKFKLLRRAVMLVAEYHEVGSVNWKHLPKWGQVRPGTPSLAGVLDDYVQHLRNNDYGRGTIHLYKVVCNQLLIYLEQSNLGNLSQLTLGDVSRFIPYASTLYQPTSMRAFLSALRCFLRYAAYAQLTGSDLTCAVPSSSVRKTQILPTITVAEERKLLAAMDRTTPLGKRNYALLLLALRLGFRSIDIVQLKLADIQWRTNCIVVIQQKTGRLLEVPLLADVGNAIIDYLLHGRPQSETPYVFLRNTAPYTPLSPNAGLWGIVSNCMKQAAVRQGNGERRGPHLLRHSVAARLLAAETPLPLISGILGHANKDTTRIYLSTDLDHLRACALGMDGIEVVKGRLK